MRKYSLIQITQIGLIFDYLQRVTENTVIWYDDEEERKEEFVRTGIDNLLKKLDNFRFNVTVRAADQLTDSVNDKGTRERDHRNS